VFASLVRIASALAFTNANTKSSTDSHQMALSSMSIVTSSKSELSFYKIAYHVLEEEPKMILLDKGIIPNQTLAHFSSYPSPSSFIGFRVLQKTV